jgi:hypothetical protein
MNKILKISGYSSQKNFFAQEKNNFFDQAKEKLDIGQE